MVKYGLARERETASAILAMFESIRVLQLYSFLNMIVWQGKPYNAKFYLGYATINCI